MWRMFWLLCIFSVLPPPAAGHSFDAAQRELLDSVVDGGARLDEGGLYVLLEWVMDWPTGDLPGAGLPDYNRLADDPAAHRGERFLLEGLLRRTRPIPLAKHGPWGQRMTEWVVAHGPQPSDVAVVYFPDPTEELLEVRTGGSVRITAALYKLWADVDQAGEPTAFLTFVARSAQHTGHAPGPGPAWLAALLLLVIVGMLTLFLFIRRVAQRKAAVRPRRLSADETSLAADALVHNPAPTPDSEKLPGDPAEALDELARRREQQ